MVIYAESSAVNDPTVLKDEKFAAVRSKIFIFKEGELYFFLLYGGECFAGKPLVDSIRHFIRNPSGVFSVCHLCKCGIVQ